MERGFKLPNSFLLPTALTSCIVKAQKNLVQDHVHFFNLGTQLHHGGFFPAPTCVFIFNFNLMWICWYCSCGERDFSKWLPNEGISGFSFTEKWDIWQFFLKEDFFCVCVCVTCWMSLYSPASSEL